jgi:hypothetical protein
MEEWVSYAPKEVREKLSVKNGDYLQYLLIKNGYVNNRGLMQTRQ